MSNRRYPNVSDINHRKTKEQCEACSNNAVASMRVQYSYMRGEDEVFWVCAKHIRIAKQNIHRFLAHCETKDSFIHKDKKEPQK